MADLVYQPPGVYINEDALPVPNLGPLVALPPSRLAIVGPSVGYQTFTDTVRLNATTPETLTHTGIDLDTIVVQSVAGATYVEVDAPPGDPGGYDLAQTGSVGEEVTTIARASATSITDGEIVYVSYQYTDSAFYLPFLSSDFDQIQSRFGPAFVPDSGVIGSPLTLAAKIAFEQGLREVVLVPTNGSTIDLVTKEQLVTAYGFLNARDDIGLVVPLAVGIIGTDSVPGDVDNVATDLATHVAAATDAGNYRRGIYGVTAGSDRSHDAIAANVASSRVMIAYPNVLNYYNGYLNKTIELDGFYLAAALAGMASSRLPQEPLTRKGVRSFSSIPARVAATMTTSAKNALSQGGVAVVEQTSDGRLVVRHGVTTDPTNATTREASIISAKDTKLKLIFQSLDQSGLIGSPTDDETPIRVRAIVEGALVQSVGIGLIVSYENLKVRQSESDPTAIEVKYSYKPSFPLNYVTVAFSINTTTGNTQEV